MKNWKTDSEPNVPKTSKKMDMKKLFRRNQIIITTLAIMIAAAGYLNYAGKQEMVSGDDIFEAGMTDISEEDILAENDILEEDFLGEDIASLDQDIEDVEQLDSQQLAVTDETTSVDTGLDNPGEAVLTSGMSVTDYISSVQLNREQVRARNKETLMSLINNQNLEESAKQQAIQEMIEMTTISEKESAAETLLLAKGFSDPVVSISSGKVDVVINASSITDPQRAQIEDIVKRKAEVGAENIVITLMKLGE